MDPNWSVHRWDAGRTVAVPETSVPDGPAAATAFVLLLHASPDGSASCAATFATPTSLTEAYNSTWQVLSETDMPAASLKSKEAKTAD